MQRVAEKLSEPLRIAVAGSVSSGKSTLVNAMLGQKIAEVDTGECTRLVTWYRYDHHERAELVLVDGTRRTLALLPGPRVPRQLGVEPEQVSHLVVWLSNERLRRVTVIDTPGLNTVSTANQAAADGVLGGPPSVGAKQHDDTQASMSQADALVFLMQHVRGVDAQTLDGFGSLFRGAGLSVVNAVGVLSKIDQLTSPEDDPWVPAHQIAERVSGGLRSVVAGVIPVIGLLAETANASQITEHDVRMLRLLAELNPQHLEDALLTGEDFLALPDDRVPRAQRQRLLGMLDLYGLRVSLDAVKAGHRNASALTRRLRELSGYAPLEALIAGLFTRRADLLKAHAGICDLVRLSYLRTDPANGRHLRGLRDPLERLQLDDRLHDLRILDILRQVDEGTIALPEPLTRDLEQLASGASPAERVDLRPTASPVEIAQAAAARATRWGVFTNDSRRSPHEARMAREVKIAYELIFTAMAARHH